MSAQQVTLLASVQQFLDRQHGLYIDGAQQAAQSEKRLTVWNPATGQAIASTADASAEISLGEQWRLLPSDEALARLRERFGAGRVSLRYSS